MQRNKFNRGDLVRYVKLNSVTTIFTKVVAVVFHPDETDRPPRYLLAPDALYGGSMVHDSILVDESRLSAVTEPLPFLCPGTEVYYVHDEDEPLAQIVFTTVLVVQLEDRPGATPVYTLASDPEVLFSSDEISTTIEEVQVYLAIRRKEISDDTDDTGGPIDLGRL